MNNDIVIDIETYPRTFTLAAEHAWMPFRWAYEISDTRNDSREIIAFIRWIAASGGRMVSFNGIGFDYSVIHMLMQMGDSDATTLYQKAMAIINSQDDEEGGRWMHTVKPSDRHVPQIDLFRLHHMDNRARSTSLKVLEFNMKMDHVDDLPFPVGTILNPDQVKMLKQYNAHDVLATKQFYHHSLDMIKFREELCVKYPGKQWLDFNDTKIGKEYFLMRLEAAGVQCYTYGANGRQPRQTRRPSIALRDAILPWIKFEHPEFHRVHQWLLQQTITETKGVFEGIIASVGGIDFVFGLGGIHASVENEIFDATPEKMILDIDVTSYYPNLSINFKFHPQHLGLTFCDVYRDLYTQRRTYQKGTAESAMLKLALNGVYGDSNNVFSPFYDPLMTMSITLNGQLLLCLLAEQLLKVDSVRIIFTNTDGVCLYMNRTVYHQVKQVCEWWQSITKLQLEEARFSRLCVADVNSYIGRYED